MQQVTSLRFFRFAARLGAAGATALLTAGCARGAGAAASVVPTTSEAVALTPPGELIALHQALVVPGLEDRRFDHGTYWGLVEPYLEAFDLEVLGVSAEGRPIRRITFGSGPTSVLLWSQMHGDESTASMALADLIRFFHDQSGHTVARRIARGATIHMVPMLNPDGAERFQRRNAQGIDVNRDARDLQTPEGRILKAVRDAVEPDFGFNLHDQNPATRVGDSDRQAAIALLAPAFNEARDIDEKRHRAMQVASLVAEAVEPLVGGHIARYDDTFNPRAFGDLIGAWGASTVLIEAGGWRDDPQKQHLRRTTFVGILSALEGVATGAYAGYDAAVYHALPENGGQPEELLITGGVIAIPGLPRLQADVLVGYEEPLLRRGGRIRDLGDLDGTRAQDTLRVDGLFLIPLPEALDSGGGLAPGAPAHFLIAEDALGERIRYRLEGGAPQPVVSAGSSITRRL